MISKEAQRLTRVVFKYSSLLKFTPWLFDEKTCVLRREKSLLPFHLNMAIFLLYNTFLIVQLRTTLGQRDPLAFIRTVIQIIAISASTMISSVSCEIVLTKDEIMEHYNTAFSYHKKFAQTYCHRKILRDGNFKYGFEIWMKLFLYSMNFLMGFVCPIFAVTGKRLNIFLSSVFINYLKSGGLGPNMFLFFLTLAHMRIFLFGSFIALNCTFLFIPQLCQTIVVLGEIRPHFHSKLTKSPARKPVNVVRILRAIALLQQQCNAIIKRNIVPSSLTLMMGMSVFCNYAVITARLNITTRLSSILIGKFIGVMISFMCTIFIIFECNITSRVAISYQRTLRAWKISRISRYHKKILKSLRPQGV
ncbi:hypothetical protein Fcan01_18694 [Folsomia candida]|uniref:Uncharacterized protein n=1 Tax=Folsomia candida TaxID=158441 RepID=A0A226DQX7_FOLCA|nr:hypothetical protein Fcan01_18694 [Folsomia candida]